MQHYDALQAAQMQGSWLAIGVFDGVHRGHQAILEQLTAGAHAMGDPAVLLTFQPHPVEVLRGPQRDFYLTDADEKLAQIKAFDIDALITQPFTHEFSLTTAKEFVQQLKTQLGLRRLWVGEDFALGHNREGDVPTLRRLGGELDFEVHVVEPVMEAGRPISSSRIRGLLREGDVGAAARLLGRAYSLSGEVERGAGRGRSIGIPTANLKVDAKRLVPALGVYAGWAQVGAGRWAAATNIGTRPTFEDGTTEPVVEAHLLDYDGGEFYGEEMRFEFVARLRDEQRFDGVEALIAQIEEDIAETRQILAEAEQGK